MDPRRSGSDVCFREGKIHRFIYVKTPKTAGTSVREALLDAVGPATLVDGESPWQPSHRKVRRSRLVVVGDVVAKRFRRRFPDIWRESLTFGVVRNPYDRLVSAWKYCESTRDHPLLEALTHQRPRRRWWRRYDHDFVHFTMRQSDFLIDSGQPIVGTVLRFERLQQALDSYFGNAGIELPRLPHRNRSKRPRVPPALMRRATLAAANRHLAPDFEHFGYPRIDPVTLTVGKAASEPEAVPPLEPA